MDDAKNPFTTKHTAAPECGVCGTSGVAVQLIQCRICHKRFCDNCAYHSRSGLFCSEICSRRFFTGDLEFDEDEDFDEDKDYDD